MPLAAAGRSRFSTALAGLAALACLLHAPRAHAGDAAPHTLTFLFEDNRVYVPVSVAGAPARWFILDTGAAPTLIDAAVARASGLKTAGDDIVTGAGAGSSHQSSTHDVALAVGDVPLHVDDAAVADLAGLLGPTSGRAPAGLIGSQFFREHVVALDFQTRQMTVHAPHADLAAQFGSSVPLRFSDAIPLADLRLTLPSGKSVACRAVVDLGAKATLLLPEPYIERLHLRAAFAHSVTSGLGAGMGGDTRYAFARANFLGFDTRAPLGLRNPVVALSVDGTLRSGWHEGLLGAEFLSRFRVAFDYANARLLLTPVADDAGMFDMSGVFLVAAGARLDRIEVRDVLADGPGARAGLRAGDRIERVDGHAADTLGLPALRTLLKSGSGKTLTLDVRRGERLLSVELRLRDLL